MLPKNRVKLVLNMLIVAAQTVPRGGSLTLDPIGEGETAGFRVLANGLNARIPQAIPGLLSGANAAQSVDAHAIQPFYTGLLARSCALSINIAAEGDGIVISAR